MKVLLITAAFPDLQAPEADHMYLLTQELIANGHEVAVLSSSYFPLRETELEVYPLMNTWSLRESKKYTQLLQKIQPDVVLMYYLGSLYRYGLLPLFLPLLTRRIQPSAFFISKYSWVNDPQKKSAGIPKVLTDFMGRHRYGTMLQQSDSLMVLSRRHKELLVEKYGARDQKITVVHPPCMMKLYPGVDARAKIQAKHGFPDDAIVVGHLGRFYPYKGIEELLEAFALAHKKNPRLVLLMVGSFADKQLPMMREHPNYERDLYAHAESLGVSYAIHWSGAFDFKEDVASQYLYASDMALLTFGRGIVMANSSFATICAHGKAIISNYVDALEAPLVHGKQGLFSDSMDPEKIGELILELSLDASARARMGEESRRVYEEYFHIQNTVKKIEGLLDEKSTKRDEEQLLSI